MMIELFDWFPHVLFLAPISPEPDKILLYVSVFIHPWRNLTESELWISSRIRHRQIAEAYSTNY